MKADSIDLEDCNSMYTGVVSIYAEELDREFSAGFPRNELSFPDTCNNVIFDPPKSTFDPFGNIEFEYESLDWNVPSLESLPRIEDIKLEPDMPIFENSSLSDVEYDYDYFAVSPNSILPNSSFPSSDLSLELLPELSFLSREQMVEMVGDGCLEENGITIDDIIKKKKPRKLTHLDIDHCYSQRIVQYVEEDDEDDDDDYLNSSPNSPASSCSDNLVAARGVKRAYPKRKVARRKKIKQEDISSEDEEVDVETPCSVQLVVPKMTIAIVPPPTLPMPSKRGRKPKNKVEGQNVKKPNRNCPVSPKVLQAAIKQQAKKSYITKSGRVSKISNSVETTPSTSTPSSVNNSRCSSDNEDTIDKRASHNMAERNRRQELTNLFQQLREKVPELKKNNKASKVAILQGAASYKAHLEEIEKQKIFLKEQLKAELESKLALVQSLKNYRGCSS